MKNTRVALALALVLGPALADADMTRTVEVRDERGRLVAVEPRQSTTISMRRERVMIVPYLAGAELRLLVHVRYVFANAGPATELALGFPDMRGREMLHPDCLGMDDEDCGDRVMATRSTIASFVADVGGPPLAVRTLPGRDDYARWFVVTAPFAAGETTVRNLYIAYPGRFERQVGELPREQHSVVEYILHTGSMWAGSIGEGEISLWEGGPRSLRRFTDLRPTRQDDVRVELRRYTVVPTSGHPDFSLTGRDGFRRPPDIHDPRLEPSSLVRESSALPQGAMPHLGAFTLDGDPTTLWIDNGPRGGVGEWFQVPTFALRRLRGLVLRSGDAPAGSARIRRLRLTCLDLEGNDQVPTGIESLPVDLEDVPGDQRVVFPHPVGACHAARFTIETLYGDPALHGALAELSFIE